jgi:hypothetical protein
MLNYSLYQLINIILLKHLNELDVFWKDEMVICRMEELDMEHDKIQEYRELYVDYSKLADQIHDIDDKEQWNEALDELNCLVTLRMSETAKFHYLTGLNDAMQVFNVS